MMICGLDEAGRGPMVGPLVVGAVWTENPETLRDIGARDSKQLSPSKRETLFSEISEIASFWETVPLSAAEIDERMAHTNLNRIEMSMFAEAVSRHPADLVQVDCPEVDTTHFGQVLSAMMNGVRVDARNKADVLFPAVSAASIMAKVTRDRIIEDIKHEVGIDIGSGYPSDPVTQAYVEGWIIKHGTLPPHARGSWKPVKDLISKKSVRSLEEWWRT